MTEKSNYDMLYDTLIEKGFTEELIKGMPEETLSSLLELVGDEWTVIDTSSRASSISMGQLQMSPKLAKLSNYNAGVMVFALSQNDSTADNGDEAFNYTYGDIGYIFVTIFYLLLIAFVILVVTVIFKKIKRRIRRNRKIK